MKCPQCMYNNSVGKFYIEGYENYHCPNCKTELKLEPLDKEYFRITRVHRDDLESIGFDTSNVSDATMKQLAGDLSNAYMNTFWIDLDILADELQIPRKEQK